MSGLRIRDRGQTATPTHASPSENGATGSSERVCIIGAGSSGIVAAQVLNARGIPFDCFEKGSYVGGNWRYMNDNGVSAAYKSLHINTSRKLMEYATFPMPDKYPDYPSHEHIAEYFDDYVDHFGLRDKITFNTEVTDVAPTEDGSNWTVSLSDGSTRQYAAVIVANGHHWDAKSPDFRGEFNGVQMHAHDYKTPEMLEGKRVLVLGIGNSATDISVEASRVAHKTLLAMRRGAYIVPKYMKGRPTDELGSPLVSRLPLVVQRYFYARALKQITGSVEAYGLPKPDHKLLQAHPTVSSDLLTRIGHGDIQVKPNIDRLEGDRVRFVDGTIESVDVIIYCTGYKITFPFFQSGLLDTTDNHVPLYRRVVHPSHSGLYFIGLLQPLGAIMPIAETQAEWVADVLEGKCELPTKREMEETTAREDARMRKRYVRSTRHTIQVDFYPYLRTIARERKRTKGGGLRAAIANRSHELRSASRG